MYTKEGPAASKDSGFIIPFTLLLLPYLWAFQENYGKKQPKREILLVHYPLGGKRDTLPP